MCAFSGLGPRVLPADSLYLGRRGIVKDSGPKGARLRRASDCVDAYASADSKVLDIAPEGGTLVAFLSERFPHEVMVHTRADTDRLSLTGWFLRR